MISHTQQLFVQNFIGSRLGILCAIICYNVCVKVQMCEIFHFAHVRVQKNVCDVRAKILKQIVFTLDEN